MIRTPGDSTWRYFSFCSSYFTDLLLYILYTLKLIYDSNSQIFIIIQALLTGCIYMGLLDERYLQEFVIPDPLIRSYELEGLVVRLRRQDQSSRQRGCTNMIIVAGGEGESDQ